MKITGIAVGNMDGPAARSQLMAASDDGMGNEDVVALVKLSHIESEH